MCAFDPNGGQDSVHNRLRDFLSMNRMSVSRFSDEFGIPRRTAHQYLSGRSKPGADHLASMARGGLNIEWLLTGEIKPQMVFDMARVRELAPVSGIILSDRELSNSFMHEAIALLDEVAAENKDFAGATGFIDLVCSAWWIFSKYAEAAEMHADQIERARHDGWTTEEIVGLITGLLREPIRKEIRGMAGTIVAKQLAARSANAGNAA